ncbi:MAG: phosphatidylglycerophosphatase A [Micavibrio sp.]|nr:phosphatidylglycerophosphatase A [Micavibrio sp.]
MTIIRRLRMKSLYVWIATWFGSGFMRPAPGTWGTLAAMPFALLLLALGNTAILIIATILISILGWWAARAFEKDSGVHDSKMIVVDEVAGLWLTTTPISILTTSAHPLFSLYVVLSFLLFRFFDIIKPWPVSYFDKRVGGALGVMADDIMAGLYAAIVLTGIIYYAGSG